MGIPLPYWKVLGTCAVRLRQLQPWQCIDLQANVNNLLATSHTACGLADAAAVPHLPGWLTTL
jgi:hypothetical protein